MRNKVAMIVGVLALVAGLSSPVRAASLSPTALCAPGRVAIVTTPLVDAGALLTAKASAAEAILAQDGGTGDAALALLDVSAEQGAGAGNLPLALYCSAAGEAMRRSSIGSQERAQSWLRAALRQAELAQDRDVAARASWRLALAIFGGPAPSRNGTRGGSLDPNDDAAPVGPASDAGQRACGGAASSVHLREDRLATGRLALRCAYLRARAAGLDGLAARVGLKLARAIAAQAALADGAVANALRLQAQAQALDALTAAARIGDGGESAELMTRLLEVALDNGLSDPPEDMLRSIKRLASNNPATLALEGRYALARGDRAAAAAAFRRAIFAEAQSPRPLRLADWHLLLARADPAHADAHVAEAYRALEQVRPIMPRIDPLTEDSQFDLALRPVFERAVDVELASTASEDGRRITAAQAIAEAYRQAELQNALGPDCVPARAVVRPVDLRAGEILLYPLLLSDRIELIYATGKDGYKRLPPNRSADRGKVAALAIAMTRSMSAGDGDLSWRDPSRALYDLLIAPLEGEIGPDTTLVIVPDGPLRGIAFGALMDGKGQYLIEKSRIAVVPALSYAQPGAGHDGRPSVVAASLTLPMDLPVGDFARLEGTGQEVALATEGGGRVLADFRKADLVRALGQQRVDVLHLATHAAFNGRSDRSFIVANGESISLPDLRDMLARNRARGETLALLILSACETAVGDNDEGMGLAGAAVEAGVQSAVASFWQVSDIGTLELMKGFYAAYRAGEGRADALRSAQLKLIRSGDESLADPNVWAAFALLGSWR